LTTLAELRDLGLVTNGWFRWQGSLSRRRWVRRHRARLEGSRNGKNTLHLHANRGRKVVRGAATIAAPDCVVGRVERQGKLVSKSEIIDVVWRGWAVEEANLYESGSLQTEMYWSSPAGPSAGIRATTSEP